MKRYEEYKSDKSKDELSDEDFKKVDWTKYKIVVPTEADRKELMQAFKHIHDSDVDTEFVVINQLSHEYLDDKETAIIVDEELFNKLNKS